MFAPRPAAGSRPVDRPGRPLGGGGTPDIPGPPRGLLDRRLTRRARVTRRYLAGAVVVGLLTTALVIVQAVLLASVIAAVMLHGAPLRAVSLRLEVLLGAFIARAALSWLGEVIAQRTSASVTSELRRALLGHALALGPSWLAGERAGEISLTATRGIDALDVYFGRYLPQAVLAAVAPVVLLVWVAVTDWVSALILLALLAVVPMTMVYFGRRASVETRRQWRRLSTLSARFFELIQGLPTLRALNRSALGRREVTEATEGLRRTTMGTLRVAFLSAFALELIAGLGTGLVAMVLGLRLLHGSVSLATALAVLLVSPEVFLPLRRAGTEFHASAEGQAAAQRILDVLDVSLPSPPGGRPGSGPENADSGGRAAGRAPDPARHRISLAGVRVAYPGRSDPALEGLDLVIDPGEHVALVGPSGAGKSTVLALLLCLLHPDEGSVRIGNVDLHSIDPADWRHRLTWVPQRPHLFSGSIAANVAMGDPDAAADQLAAAVELAGLAEFVGRLPDGLETVVGEGGLILSAGERQRVGLARAVLRDVPLVLLDEPAAHLDAPTEDRLRAGLDPWWASRTVVVAAHRAELVGRIDRIVSLPPSPDRSPVPLGQSGEGPADPVEVVG
jgi:thiol reductant ABC exporter CydD subunit